MDFTNHPSIVTLLTDFGLQDEYVGVMKGVIFRYAPETRIVDISHLIAPHAIAIASHLLSRSYKYFPDRTVHLTVVDPGVGSERAILAIAADSHYFVGPDNGIFTPILDNAANLTVHRVDTSCFEQKGVSSTFHGRDIMAPVAGQLAVGMAISTVGPQITPEQCLRLDGMACTLLDNSILGEVIHIDIFGNLRTNIHRQDIENFTTDDKIVVIVLKDLIVPFGNTYTAQKKGMVLALYDSHDYLEIAITMGNASRKLRLDIGAKIIVSRH